MSKVDPVPVGAFSPTDYITADDVVKHFGLANVAALPTSEQQRYNDYAAQANKATETVIYKYIDTIPLETNDEALTYARGMALYYALWLKQADDGANNITAMKEIWESYRDDLIKVLKSQPKGATTRRMVSNGFPDLVIPYSQSYGLSDIL